jgi:hypothetical protein
VPELHVDPQGARVSAAGSGTLGGGAPTVTRFEVDIPALFVKRVTLGSDHELSMATFGVHPQGQDTKDIRFESVWKTVKKGQRVKVTLRAGQSTPIVLFHGWITEAQIRAGGRMEDVEYTALGLEWGLKVERIFGSWCANKDGDKALWLRAVQAVFNKDGKYNKHTTEIAGEDGKKRPAFDLDDDVNNPKNAWWPASVMVRYCIACERKGDLSTKESSVFKDTKNVGSELADFRPFDVNVEGEDIWSAVVRIAALCSHGVRLKHNKDREKPELVFFTKKLDEAKQKKQFEFPGATLEALSLTDYGRVIASLDLQDDLSGIVRQVDAVCPPKLFEHEFTMLAGWTQEDEDAAFGEGSVDTKVASFLKETDPEASSDWARFQNVGRRYILNETGRDQVKGKPEAYDFGTVFGGEDWAPHLRPFRHQLVSTNDEGTPLPVEIHAVWPGQSEDVKLGEHCEMLHDRAGLYFRARPLIQPNKVLASGSTSQMFPTSLKVKAVVEGDQDAPHDVHGISSSDEQPVPTYGILRLDDGFRENNVDEDANDGIREKAQQLCDEAVSQHKDRRLVGTAVCPWITMQFDVGDVITNINGRDLAVKAQIAKVTYDAEQQSTEFALHYPEIDTHTHARDHHHSIRGSHVGAHSDRSYAAASELLARRDAGLLDDSPLQSDMLTLAAKAALTGHHQHFAEHVIEEALLGRGFFAPKKEFVDP